MSNKLKRYSSYKDSGVPWFGQVPAHWGVDRLGAILKERGETNQDGEVTQVLSLLRDRGVIPYEEKGNIGNKRSEDITRYKIVRPNDIVMNSMNVIIGSVGRSQYTGCLSPVYYVLQPRKSDEVGPQGTVVDDRFEKRGSTGRIWFIYDPENTTNGPSTSILPESGLFGKWADRRRQYHHS